VAITPAAVTNEHRLLATITENIYVLAHLVVAERRRIRLLRLCRGGERAPMRAAVMAVKRVRNMIVLPERR
jgi:hypothetical protein